MATAGSAGRAWRCVASSKFDDQISSLFRAVEYLTGGSLLPELTFYDGGTPPGPPT